MNLLAQRLIQARTAGEIINYHVAQKRLEFLTPARKFNDKDTLESVGDVSVERMLDAVRQTNVDVAAHVLTIWS